MRDTVEVKVISVNVGLPQDLQVGERTVRSGIVKTPIAGPVRVATLNLAGDAQADLEVHGGVDKAVYAYPYEHYGFWRQQLGVELPYGAFGENLTVTGFDEATLAIGDQLGIGTAVFAVSQPRLPCFKLAAKFRRNDIIQKFLESRRTGFYLRVLNEGILQADDPITVLQEDPARVSVREITDLYVNKRPSRNQLQRVLAVESLPVSWRNHFLKLLA